MSNPYVVTDEMVDDILDAALYGGITYWCGEMEPVRGESADDNFSAWSECLTHGWTLRLREDGDTPDEPVWHELTREKFVRGLRATGKLFGQTPEYLHLHGDAGTADCVVQMAIFGEVVYG